MVNDSNTDIDIDKTKNHFSTSHFHEVFRGINDDAWNWLCIINDSETRSQEISGKPTHWLNWRAYPKRSYTCLPVNRLK
jgi:hypothetical protein